MKLNSSKLHTCKSFSSYWDCGLVSRLRVVFLAAIYSLKPSLCQNAKIFFCWENIFRHFLPSIFIKDVQNISLGSYLVQHFFFSG